MSDIRPTHEHGDTPERETDAYREAARAHEAGRDAASVHASQRLTLEGARHEREHELPAERTPLTPTEKRLYSEIEGIPADEGIAQNFWLPGVVAMVLIALLALPLFIR